MDKLPKGWRILPFEKVVLNLDSKRIPLKSGDRDIQKGDIPYYGASGIIDYIDKFIFDGEHLLISEDGANLLARTYPIAFIANGRFWVNNHAHILKGKNGFDENSLFVLLNNTNISDIITGGVQAKISQTNLKTVKISIPPQDLIQALNKKLKPIFNLKIQTLEIQKICFKLKEILLSKMATTEESK